MDQNRYDEHHGACLLQGRYGKQQTVHNTENNTCNKQPDPNSRDRRFNRRSCKRGVYLFPGGCYL